MKKRLISLLVLAVLLLCQAAPAGAAISVVSNYSFAAGKSSVTVLMYHQLSNSTNMTENQAKSAFCLPVKTFEDDIRYLKENGYMFCFASEVDDVLNNKKPRGKYIAVTFDDGYESDFYYVLPILEKYGVKATFFVVAARLGIEDHSTEEHLSLLAKSDFVEIGSHSYRLHNKTAAEIKQIFSGGNTELITYDFKRSADLLEKITGKKITVLSYPNGIWSAEADSALRTAAGYTATFTSDDKRSVAAGVPHGRKNRWQGAVLKNLLTK